jgi:hypothetical protein
MFVVRWPYGNSNILPIKFIISDSSLPALKINFQKCQKNLSNKIVVAIGNKKQVLLQQNLKNCCNKNKIVAYCKKLLYRFL